MTIPILELTFFFLDRGKPESGGIFDPKRAEQFEYRAYAREKAARLGSAEARFSGITQAIGKERSERLRERIFLKALEPIEEWRSQIVQRYGKFNPQ